MNIQLTTPGLAVLTFCDLAEEILKDTEVVSDVVTRCEHVHYYRNGAHIIGNVSRFLYRLFSRRNF